MSWLWGVWLVGNKKIKTLLNLCQGLLSNQLYKQLLKFYDD